jgi:hypothetical protein
MIGTVLTYQFEGVSGACGQTVGADGAGTYAVVFLGDNVEATEFAACQYARKLTRIRHLHIVSAKEEYSGIPLRVVQV